MGDIRRFGSRIGVVYVAGPYRDKTENGVFANIQAARVQAERLWLSGFVAICPQLNTAFMGGLVPDRQFLDGDLEIMARCDAVFVVGGWQGSQGTKREIKAAEALRIPVFFILDELIRYQEGCCK